VAARVFVNGHKQRPIVLVCDVEQSLSAYNYRCRPLFPTAIRVVEKQNLALGVNDSLPIFGDTLYLFIARQNDPVFFTTSFDPDRIFRVLRIKIIVMNNCDVYALQQLACVFTMSPIQKKDGIRLLLGLSTQNI
jgi:hypothetical protein